MAQPITFIPRSADGGQFIFAAPKANVVIVRTGSDFGIDIVQWSQVFQYIADAVSRGEASPSVP